MTITETTTEAKEARARAGGREPVAGAGAGKAPASDEEPGAVAWQELVTAALLGAERRTPPGGSPKALLALAARETVRRRAGLLPAMARPRPVPAPA
ncbi:hypothetical protein HPT28_05760, partial [Streptomyces sp. JJ38]|nr:hypothetical protein [Streptomyces sp. JJ38]